MLSLKTRYAIEKLITEEFHLVVAGLLKENKQSIKNLGYPDVIASIFQNDFGDKKGFLLAKWFKDYSTIGMNTENDKDWFRIKNTSFFKRSDSFSLLDFIDLYESIDRGEEEYNKVRESLGLSKDEGVFSAAENKVFLYDEIKETFYKKTTGAIFFGRPFIKDIIDGKITDLKPYAKLPFTQASEKYESKKVKDPSKVIKTYDDGYKWINIGLRCDLVGKQMKNCGSAGVMSSDEDRTIVVLYDKQMKPRVIVTYSPNEHRISGVQGKASSDIKDKYFNYVKDLTEVLGAKLDGRSSGADELKAWSVLGDRMKSITLNRKESTSVTKRYNVTTTDGTEYLFDGHKFIPIDVIKQLKDAGLESELGMLSAYWSQQTKDIVGDSIIEIPRY